ncbi:MAG: hypothetical protein VXW49_11585, partial [Pseudomonadota bacterium]|nr:hypothetical protein [Pseudomonadota bacterium]
LFLSNRVNNKTGYVGVYTSKFLPKGKFAAQIQTGGKNRCLGYFDTKVDAGKLLIVVDKDCCGTLPAVLSARITAGFDRTHQAVF